MKCGEYGEANQHALDTSERKVCSYNRREMYICNEAVCPRNNDEVSASLQALSRQAMQNTVLIGSVRMDHMRSVAR
jgi:hypothetical protein